MGILIFGSYCTVIEDENEVVQDGGNDRPCEIEIKDEETDLIIVVGDSQMPHPCRAMQQTLHQLWASGWRDIRPASGLRAGDRGFATASAAQHCRGRLLQNAVFVRRLAL
jgi:hypothetical protein